MSQNPPPNTQGLQFPLLSEQTLVWLGLAVLGVMCVTTLLVHLTIRQRPALLRELVSLNVLHLITVLFVLFVTCLLALEGVLCQWSLGSAQWRS